MCWWKETFVKFMYCPFEVIFNTPILMPWYCPFLYHSEIIGPLQIRNFIQFGPVVQFLRQKVIFRLASNLAQNHFSPSNFASFPYNSIEMSKNESDRVAKSRLQHKRSLNSMENENAWALTGPPAMCPLCQYSSPKVVKGCQEVTAWCQVTWRHDIVPWRHITSGVMIKWLCAIYIGHTMRKSRKITFFKMATLTFDLWPWPSNLSEILS